MRVLELEEHEFASGGRSSGSGGRGGGNHGGGHHGSHGSGNHGHGGGGHPGSAKSNHNAPSNHKGSGKEHQNKAPAVAHSDEHKNEFGISLHRNFDNRDPSKTNVGADVKFNHKEGDWSVTVKGGFDRDDTGHFNAHGEVGVDYKF